uniref:Crystaline entomocidal protoxin n=1 Tax=Bacillus thuringiensis TaxID=1428 RepID=Q8VUL0_BACTU|nr:crystal protein CryE6Q [Bacillus thuringiensis]
MNSNYNNEHEILDMNNRSYQTRYPLANAPGVELQQMSYKDWMDRCEQESLAITFKSVITTALDITSAILGAAKSPKAKVARAAVQVLNTVIKLLWPDPEKPSEPAYDIDFIWKELIGRVEILIEEKIDREAYNAAIGRLSGLKRALSLYQESFETWIDDENDPELQEDVRMRFTSTLFELVTTIETFKYSGQELNLLTVFVQAADFHLMLLQQGVMYGVRWGFDQRTVDSFYQNDRGEGLKNLLPKYSDYCTYWYDQGLNRAKNLKANLSDTVRYPWAANLENMSVLQELEDWNLYNDYRRDMTILVLDLVAVWPTYDLHYYDNGNYGVQSELTRSIYSQAVGNVMGTVFTKEQYEVSFVRPPHLVTWLEKMFIQIRPTEQGAPIDATMAGVSLYYSYSGWDNTVDDILLGYPTYSSSEIRVLSKSKVIVQDQEKNRAIYNTDLQHDKLVDRFVFYQNSGEVNYAGRDNPSSYKTFAWDTDITNYSSQMTWINGPVNEGHFGYIQAYAPEWIPASCEPFNNIVDAEDVITQIPAVKARELRYGARVIKGVGNTGGDLVSIAPHGLCELYVSFPNVVRRYQVRIHYACQDPTKINLNIGDSRHDITLPSTYSGGALTYDSFGYATSEYSYLFYADFYDEKQIVRLGNSFDISQQDVIIDKIEFIPVDIFYAEEQDLEKARKAVNALFTNDAKNALQLDVTDYAVDQAANLVECVSDEFHAQEKMILLDQVKFAKRLSQARNLLNYGDFESSDWSGENGWRTSPHVHVASDNPIFKGRYLHMSGAMSPQFSNNIYPTYAYQKVDESKLKSYTRYLVRGFVGNSKDLELLVERYGKDVYVEMDVPNDIRYTLPRNECGDFDRCKPASYQTKPPHTCTCKDPAVAHTDCQCKDKGNHTSTNMYTNGPTGSEVSTNGFHAHKSCGCGDKHMDKSGTHPHKSCGCKDPHVFTYHIDTGCVDTEENLGLFFALKIASENGVANIDNLEIIEAQPLTGEALARVKKREQRWKQEMTKKRLETETAVQAAQDAIQNLFTNTQYNRLKFETLFPHIVNAELLVQQIPYVYHPFLSGALPVVPGMNFDIFQQLSFLIDTAKRLYEARNLVQNGTFSSGTGSWYVTAGVEVHRLQNTSVLVLSEWSHEASQQVRIDSDRGYVLRVTARKEGAGKGTVTLSDCADYTETLSFTSCDYNTVGTQTMTKGTLSGFVTKTLENFPDTDRIRIDIGETEGTFKVESVELICMEQMEDHLYDMAGNLEQDLT